MAAGLGSSGKYTVFVTGGMANVGYKAKMNFYGRQKRGYSTNIPTRTTVKLSGPGQVLEEIPSSILSEVVLHLNSPSPLRNNWQAIAAEMMLTYQTVQNLDHHSPGGMMDGVLAIMFQRKMTVGDLVQLLVKIKRPDVVEILIKAGLPKNSVHAHEDETDVQDNQCSGDDLQATITMATPEVSSQATSNACADKRSFDDKSFNQPKIDFPNVKNTSEEAIKVSKECNLYDSDSLGCDVICKEVDPARGSTSAEAALEDKNPDGSIISGIVRSISCGKLCFRANQIL